jgi:hypothetical protein
VKFNRSIFIRSFVLISLMASLTGLSTRLQADTGNCGGVTITLPFNDVMASPFFCQIAAAYFSGLTNGTGDGTTYSPTQTVTREQMAAFISRTMDQSLKRGSRRAVAKKWWTPQDANSLGLTDLGNGPQRIAFDGTDLWVVDNVDDTVSRVRASDGKVLETWTGANNPRAILAAFGRIYVTDSSPMTGAGTIYVIDPKQPAGSLTLFASNLAFNPEDITTDGAFLWVACTGIPEQGPSGLCRVDIQTGAVTTFTAGLPSPNGILYDGTSIWITDGGNSLKRINPDGTIAQLFTLAVNPISPLFDGTNIWVLNSAVNFVTVVRVKDANGAPLTNAFILATLSGNGLNSPSMSAFDGERIMVINANSNSVSMWKASDLSPLGNLFLGVNTGPSSICSDGLNFWITLRGTDKLARF